MIFNTIIILSIVLSCYYFNFLLKIYLGLSHKENTIQKIDQYPSISIIIPFRNEGYCIIKNIISLNSIVYPENKFEIVYVDDNSTDDSVKKIKENSKVKNIRIISLNELNISRGFKKRAIEEGLTKAKNEWIIISDADCEYNPMWLSSMSKLFDKNTGFVAGPVEYEINNNLTSSLLHLEFAGLVTVGAGLINMNEPIICNAANIAFRKQLFYSGGGYNNTKKLSSGDDDAIMQNIFYNSELDVKFCMDKTAVVKTFPPGSFHDFIEQRKRWASKSLFYRKEIVVKLIMIFLFYCFLFSLPLAAISVDIDFLLIFVPMLMLKIVLEYFILKKSKKKLFDRIKLSLLPLAELLQIPYIIISSLLGSFGGFEWKGRKLKR